MTQPQPHLCDHPPTSVTDGCPRWPSCLDGALWDALDAEPDDDEIPGLSVSLAALAGYAAACVIFLVVVAILLPLFV